MTETGAPPRALIIAAAVLAVALAAAVAVLGLLSSSGEDSPDEPGPLPLVSIPAPQADSRTCAALIDAAPAELESAGRQLQRRELAKPAPPATLAWGLDNPVVLRCGLDRPPELTRTSSLRQINGVRWLEVPGEGSSTWYVVDRPVYAALTVPADAGTGPLQQISDTVAATLKQTPLRFG
ncbi:DUF3515 domain-containing protein [Prauserella muralis]|uniref:Uncharacterized protein n=1 Tax=Prauserella muralis TaxID=588067 RepID=A0A2V4B106_9PSEU|nr:DUF3515 domain-containing protein [Prauserella muralis]PXY27058.1 hypothetical protein BAY60_11255 [Prauserella muralis]TWE23314.1 uncharacterized protein DUF3515 [Prauserella muralis]